MANTQRLTIGLTAILLPLFLSAITGCRGMSAADSSTVSASNRESATIPSGTQPRGTQPPGGLPVVWSNEGLDYKAPIVTTWMEDATQYYYNATMSLSWESKCDSGLCGDWLDANGVLRGTAPLASKALIDTDARQVVEIDVTEAVAKYGADFLINRSGGTTFSFYSREATDSNDRPALIINRATGSTTLSASADTSLDSSTAGSLGAGQYLATQYGFLIKFPQGPDASIVKATLRLVASPAQFGNQTLRVFRAYPHVKPVPMPQYALGTAADVVLYLHGANWKSLAWSIDLARGDLGALGEWIGAVQAGQATGFETRYRIPPEGRQTEMFMRTIMKAHMDFDPDWSGKFPGLSNEGVADNRPAQCGNGGALADGTCWSARTFFMSAPNEPVFGKDYMHLGSYMYRVNRETNNGDEHPWNYPIKRGVYFVMDQRVKLNTINADGTANADGELSYWLNGVPVFQWGGIIWRSHEGPDTLPSEAWPNMYIGGVGYSAPHPHGFSFYSISVSKKLLPFDSSILNELNK